MIFGVGTDIVAVARLGKLYERHGERALGKLLAPAERADFTRAADAARFLAKRFAAKEALGKALGIGVAPPATLGNSAVTHDELGMTAHLSISDEQDFALAFVVIERA